MKILSLFDWMACWYEALQRAGIKIDKYYASEIDKYAIQIATKNHPDIEEIWDVCNIHYTNWYLSTYEKKEWWSTITNIAIWKIDLVIGWSPCQWFSVAGKMLNFDDPRSKLFFEFLRLKEEIKPKYFLLENVKMKKERVDIISEYLGVQPIEINSSLVSGQSRKRLYRTNIPGITQPEDKGILLKDILEGKVDEKYYLTDAQIEMIRKRWGYENPLDKMDGDKKGKCYTLTTHTGKMSNGLKLVSEGDKIRKLTPIECERLQTLPDNYTEGVNDSQRYKMLWNWWTLDVIAHIFRFIKE